MTLSVGVRMFLFGNTTYFRVVDELAMLVFSRSSVWHVSFSLSVVRYSIVFRHRPFVGVISERLYPLTS